MTDIVALTEDYERWLRKAIDVIDADLTLKHTELAANPMRFLRGTYYYWLRRMAGLLPDLTTAPAVALVGDLHAENFGTWTDQQGVARWGVNDLDELAHGPYPIDLVRLATSCVLSPHVAVDDATICDVLLDGWLNADPGHAVKVNDAEHLHHLLPAPHSDAKYYAELAAGAAVDAKDIPTAVVDAVDYSVDDAWDPTWHRRRAGTGSLGHQRIVALEKFTAREVKELGPPSATWADVTTIASDPDLYEDVLEALRGPYPATRTDGWQLRRLAPDEVRIDISALNPHAIERVLHSMAHAVVTIHGVDVAALQAARTDAAARPKHWLRDAVAAMTTDTRAAYKDWRTRTD